MSAGPKSAGGTPRTRTPPRVTRPAIPPSTSPIQRILRRRQAIRLCSCRPIWFFRIRRRPRLIRDRHCRNRQAFPQLPSRARGFGPGLFRVSGRFPVLAYETSLGNNVSQREHRRVGGEGNELPAGRRQLEGAVESGLQVGHDLDRSLVEASVLKAQSQFCRSVTARDETIEAGEEGLEVDVPDPGDVLAVRGRVV